MRSLERVRVVGERPREKGVPEKLYALGPAPQPSANMARTGMRKGKGKRAKRRAKAAPAARVVKRGRPKGIACASKPGRAKGVEHANGTKLLGDFRCGRFSDGTFSISCADGAITLSAAEARAMADYVRPLLETK